MKRFAFFAFFLVALTISAQDKIEPVQMVQGNFQIIPASVNGATFSYDNATEISYYFAEDLTAAFGWMRFKKKNFRMMEISNISISYPPTREYIEIGSNIYSVQNATFSGAYRLEYGKAINKTDAKCIFLLSGGIKPFVNYVVTQPNTSDVSPMRYLQVGLVGEIIPRLMFRLSPKFLLDVNAPIGLLNMDFNRFVADNPALPIDQRLNSITNFSTTLQNIGFRIGLTRQI